MAQPTGYSPIQIILHWLIAIGIFAAFFTHEVMHTAFDERLAAGTTPGFSDGTLHTMIGGSVFALVIVRLIVRMRLGAPAPHGQGMIAAAAHWGHLLIYVLMIGVPLGGMIAWFGGVEGVGDLHGIAGKGLMIIVLGHAGMALYHQYGLKDGTLDRMTRPTR